MRRLRRYSVIAGLAVAAALGDVGSVTQSVVRAQQQLIPHGQDQPPNPPLGRRSGPDDDSPAGLSR